MSVLSRENFSIGALLIAVLVLLGAAAVATAFALPIRWLMIYWIAIGGLSVLLTFAVAGDLLVAVLLWFFTLICLHEEFWRETVPFFFAVTIPRLGLVVLVVLFGMMLLLGRIKLRFAGWIGATMIALAAYFTVSAAITGFDTHSPITVHYRLIGGYLFPFTVFALVLMSIRNEASLKKIAWFFCIIGVYLAFTGWMEHFQVWSLVWPRFIADPTVGIHYGRVRGPFVMSAAMGLSLVYCFFNNLVLARQTGAVTRWLIYFVNLLTLPAIFWTHTRSVWLSFLLCAAAWVLYSRRRTTRALGVTVLAAMSIVVGILNIENFLTDAREKGGITDVEPILVRLGLAKITWHMFEDRPIFGVGFGHFRDYAPDYANDPSSPFYAFASTAMEHNNQLSILAETGVVGLVIYVVLLIMLIRLSFKLYHKLPVTAVGFINRDLIVLYWVLVIAYLTDGTFRETSDNPFANSLFFGLSAAIVALNELLGPRPLEALRPSARPGLVPALSPSVARGAPARPSPGRPGG